MMKSYDYYYLAKKNLLPDAEMRTRIPGLIKKGAKVHVSAVCGKAMASIACMLKEFGCIVTGSDVEFNPPMSGVLESHEIPCLTPSVENLNNLDILVVGNALSPNALEVVEARRRNIPMVSGAEAVAQIFDGRRSLVVTGTHGKTTTSALLTHIFLESKKKPAYMIGGVFQKSDDSYSIGGGDSNFVIYEGDEYNCSFFDRAPKFLRYNTTSAILTSIEQDHVDLYPTFEDYKQAFQFLIDDLPADGFLVMHESVVSYVDISKCLAKVFVYGSSKSSDIYYDIHSTDSNGTSFSFYAKDIKDIKNINIPLFGEYNVANATAVCALSLLEGISSADVLKGLANFAGTKERQELLGSKSGEVAIIRDYAHHPTAVSLTLDGLRLRSPKRRLVVVFEPRSASSKRKVFESRYGESLRQAEVSIIITPVIKDATDSDVIDTSNIKRALESFGRLAYEIPNPHEFLNIAPGVIKAGDVVIFMSSGDLGGVPIKFLES